MILTVKIDIEQSTENLMKVLDALKAFEVSSTTWGEPKSEVKVDPSLRTSRDGDPAAALSAALNSATVRRARDNG